MLRKILPFFLTAVLVVQTTPARADTSIGGYAPILFVGSAVASGANIIAATLYDGSVGLGIAGVAVGSTLVIYASTTDELSGDEDFYIAAGLITVCIGLGDILVARSSHDPQLLGMHVAPFIGSFDERRSLGLQLMRTW